MQQPPNATGRDRLLHELTPSQTLALEALDAGSTHAEAAAAAGVDRTTVSRWATRHPGFVAEINRRKSERAHEHRREVEGTTARALTVVKDRIDSGDAEFALRWLKLIGMGTLINPSIGPTEPDSVIEGHRRAMGGDLLSAFETLGPPKSAAVLDLVALHFEDADEELAGQILAEAKGEAGRRGLDDWDYDEEEEEEEL